MCGICGVMNFNAHKADKQLLRAMCAELTHRGPDSEGYYLQDNLGLGHRRLAIIDLATGDQPIHNEDKTIWLIVNGEIYNFRSLRQELEKKGHHFYTSTDSEVIVHLYEEYKQGCLEYLRGMFAFALWDNQRKTLFLARDRLGKKPLVYSFDEKRIIFASELRAIVKIPDIIKEVDIEALNLYLSFFYVPAPWTMFKNIKKLPPAHYMIVKNADVEIKRYWSLDFKIDHKRKLEEYKQGLLEKLDEAVALRLVSDVPLGVFLSGGIDSSTVVGLMSKHLTHPVKTFSVGFSEKLYNELYYARIISKKFKTEHYELIIKPNAVEILPQIIKHYGEPFADYSCIPTYYLSKFAASRVKVALTGDGGDESFAGYYRYTAAKAAENFDHLPKFISSAAYKFAHLIPRGKDIRAISWQLRRFFENLHYCPQERYINWISAFNPQEKISLLEDHITDELNLNKAREFFFRGFQKDRTKNFVNTLISAEINSYLPYDLLVKMDIATMMNSLEARSPFLDHKFMEFAATIPLDFKLHHFNNKFILKQTFKDLLPPVIVNRSKKGFGMPIGEWFRGQLRNYMQEVLLDRQTIKRGYFKENYLRNIIKEHTSGATDNGHKLWTIMIFELWNREFLD